MVRLFQEYQTILVSYFRIISENKPVRNDKEDTTTPCNCQSQHIGYIYVLQDNFEVLPIPRKIRPDVPHPPT